MCEYAEIENLKLSNGKTVKEVNENVRKEIEHIYLEGWAKGISIPFWDKQGNFYLANPDGSEDLVEFNRKERSYKVISRVADKGQDETACEVGRSFGDIHPRRLGNEWFVNRGGSRRDA